RIPATETPSTPFANVAPASISPLIAPRSHDEDAPGVGSATADGSLDASAAASGVGQDVEREASDAAGMSLGDTTSPADPAALAATATAGPPVSSEVPLSPAELLLRDLEGLETALGSLLGRLDDLGEDLAERVFTVGTLEVLLGLGLGCVAVEV